MKLKFCLPIIKESQKEVINMIDKNINDFNFFEVWIDHVKDADQQFIKALISLLKEKLIIVLRRSNSKHIVMELKRRYEIINLLNGQSAMLDLDINKQKEEILFIKKNKLSIPLIISFHNYEKTESKELLEKIINKIERFNPGIIKISTMCKNKNDALRLMEILLKIKQSGEKYIILGMGKDGVITRVFSSLWGNEIIYTPVRIEERTAPGQLTKSQLKKIFEILKN